MIFRNYNDLYFDLLQWATQLPRDIDLFVGIPRSGILVAFMLAQIRNIHFGSVESFVSGNYEHGRSRRVYGQVPPRKVFVVDDTLATGATMSGARKKLAGRDNILYGAVYVSKGKGHLVDFYYRRAPGPRGFAWQIFHSGHLANACVDIDGVICLDPVKSQNDGDGPRYQEFLKTATPLIIPTYPIHSLVTSRLERWRGLTEQWLKQYNVQYKNLIMSQCKSARGRGGHKEHAMPKALYYQKTRETYLFIESSPMQAEVIHKVSGKAVLCSSTMQLIA